MHLRKGKKFLVYFLLLISLSSINNFELKDFKFFKNVNIEISGFNSEENKSLLEKIKKINLKNIFFLKSKEIDQIIKSNSLIEKYSITRIYPSTIYIKIYKTNFLARIKSENQIYLVGSNGKLSKNNFAKDNLPFIFGSPDIAEFLKFKDIIDDSKLSYEDVKNIYFFSSKRWDLKLKNNILIKLPKIITTDFLNDLIEFINNDHMNDILIVDARIKNQIIINE
tara:strand:+ start:409 stop:1080 length:672 start_codon:yes stop_codon:yes gene_type:complete